MKEASFAAALGSLMIRLMKGQVPEATGLHQSGHCVCVIKTHAWQVSFPREYLPIAIAVASVWVGKPWGTKSELYGCNLLSQVRAEHTSVAAS